MAAAWCSAMGCIETVVGTVAVRGAPRTQRDGVSAKTRRNGRCGQRRLSANRRDIWRAVNGVIERDAVLPELGAVTTPTLNVVGDEDVAAVPAKADQLHAAIRAVLSRRTTCRPDRTPRT